MTPACACIPEGLPADVAHTAAEVVARVLQRADPAASVRAWLRTDELADCMAIRVLAFGKASVPMAGAALRRLGERVSDAVVLTPPEWSGRLTHPRARVFAVDHPVPSERNVEAAKALAACAMDAGPRECVLALISGGGSAHLTLPRAGVTLEDVRAVTRDMLRAGAPIDDLNTVRRSMEQLKGGGLRAVCPAERVVGLILSDVVGDDPAVVASGPLCDAEPGDPLGVLGRWGVRVRPEIAGALRTPRRPIRRTPAEHHVVLGGATMAGGLPEALAEPTVGDAMPLRVARVVSPLTGEASLAGEHLADELTRLPVGRACEAVLGWGETTVTVGDAPGLGGRSLELALGAAKALPGDRAWGLVSFATDGVDGPTDAAGAVLCSEMFEDPRAGVLAGHALANHDSYHAVEMLGGLIRTGPTGTNLNDVAVLWWRDDA